MGFVGNYAPRGLAPQIDDMPVIPKNHRRTNDPPMVPVSCSIWFFPTAFPFLLPPIHFQMEVCADPLIPSN